MLDYARLHGHHRAVRKTGATGKPKRAYCKCCVKEKTSGGKVERQYFTAKGGLTSQFCDRCLVPVCSRCWTRWHGQLQLTRPSLQPVKTGCYRKR